MLNRLSPMRRGFLLLLILLASCASQPTYEYVQRQTAAVQTYEYQRDIKPILDNKCIACHACYDAPCQLKLSSSQGLARGASKHKVYDGARLEDAPPTRLHIDALDITGWRNKGFFSVLDSSGEELSHSSATPDSLKSESEADTDNDRDSDTRDAESLVSGTSSLLLGMVELARRKPLPVNQPVPDELELGIDRSSSCPSPGQFHTYASDNPLGGMPYAVSGLSDEEYHILKTWVEEGAQIEHSSPHLPKPLQQQIERWEVFFNQTDNRSRLVSRYLYEHLFLAHIQFDDIEQGDEQATYFRLIRSYSPPGRQPLPIATVRPNDDPGKVFYYRLVPINDTIVHKTHILYALNDKRMQRYQELFYGSDWLPDPLPGYTYEEASNPFLAFRAIPAKARYQFMLDEAEYFTRTFIRGPVCRGQIATDVIRDHFWVMYEDPDTDQYSNDESYRQAVTPLLGLPGRDSDLSSLGSNWIKYQSKRNNYQSKRQSQYAKAFPEGPQLSHIWDGDGYNTNAFLTILRHHNSATVMRGWKGQQPLTQWWMDYPLFERTYYELVVGFNVFGSLSHQAQTRLYFDLIRNGGETNFLRLLPSKEREALYDTWYQESGQLKAAISYKELDIETPTAIAYAGHRAPQYELTREVINSHPALLGGGDPLNRCVLRDCPRPGVTDQDLETDRYFRALTQGRGSTHSGISWLPDVTFVRVDYNAQDSRAYTIVRNRAHTNVAFMLGESLRYQPELDYLSVFPESVSSYPNFIFRVDAYEVKEFVDKLSTMNSAADRQAVVNRWGIRRTHPEFWSIFHSFHNMMKETQPSQAGVFDLNRYEGW